MARMAKTAVYTSTSTPVPVSEYKATTPPYLASKLNAIKEMALAAKRKALLAVSYALEKLNISRIKAFLDKVVAVRNEVMNSVAAGIAWYKAAVKGMTNLINDVVSSVRNFTQTLSNLVKQSGIYKIANELCSGFDLSGIAAELNSIQIKIDTEKVLDFALSGGDPNLFNHIKNCQVFDKDSLNMVLAALDHMFDDGNFIMLDCMKDTTDYWDIHGVDRKFKEAAKVMDDSTLNAEALRDISIWMNLSEDFMVTLDDDRFAGMKVYNAEDTVTLNTKTPEYVKTIIGDTNRNLLVAASAYL